MIHTENGLIWNLFSIYYSRDSWKIIVDELVDLKKKLTNEYVDFIIFFSEEKGENIRVAISSTAANNIKITYAIESLNRFIKSTPSKSFYSFPYGKTLWKNHDNNSIVWNTFIKIESYEEPNRFEQSNSNLLLEILDNDYTSDNFLTAGLYLYIKILKQFHIYRNNTNKIITEAMESLSDKFENFELRKMIDNIISEYQIDKNSIFEILDDFWHESNDSPAFIEWASIINILIEHKINFMYINQIILDHLGLGYSHNMLILELLYRWNMSRYCELN